MNKACSATARAGHIRRPKPKGKSKSTARGCVGFRKRSGRKSSGASPNISGSCEIALTPFPLRSTRVMFCERCQYRRFDALSYLGIVMLSQRST